MMIDFLNRRSRFSILIMLLLSFLTSCSRGNREVAASLDRIEQVVEQHPDSALIELVRLDSLLDAGAVSIEGDRQMARYALLKTQTHDKNYIDDTSDSLILRAVRYYDEHGSKREQMLAHFYHGAIFRNAKDYGAAFVAYRQAESLALDSEDYHYLSLIYGNLSALSYETYSNDVFSYGRKSLKYAWLSNNIRQSFSMRADMARAFSARLLYDSAEFLFNQVIDSLPASDPIVQSCLTSYIEQCISNEKYQLADSLIGLTNHMVQPVDMLNKAGLFQMKGICDSTSFYIRRAEQSITCPEHRVFYYEKLSWIAEMRGDDSLALSYKKKRLYLQNEILTDIFSKSVSSYQRDFERLQKELVQSQYEVFRFKSILVVACIFLISALLCAYYYRLSKHLNQELVEAIKKNFNQDVLLVNKNTKLGEQKIKIEELESLLQEARGVSIANRLSRLFARHINLYNRFGYTMYKTQGKIGRQQIIYQMVDEELKRLCSDKKILTKVDQILDDSFDNAMSKAKRKEIGLKDDDLRLVRYMLMHLSSRTIAYLFDIDPLAVYKRKTRIIEKLAKVGNPISQEILSLFDYLKEEDHEEDDK